jgi:hypothetical protein
MTSGTIEMKNIVKFDSLLMNTFIRQRATIKNKKINSVDRSKIVLHSFINF